MHSKDILTLIDVNNVDFEDSYIKEDGRILLGLKQEVLQSVGQLNDFYKTIFHEKVEKIKFAQNPKFYLVMCITDQISFNGFAVMTEDEMPIYAYVRLSQSTLEKENKITELIIAVDKWLREKVRRIIESHRTCGIFKDDYLKSGTYFQCRKQNDLNIFYIIYRYWEKIKNEKDSNITWIDIMEDENGENKCNGHVFISLSSV